MHLVITTCTNRKRVPAPAELRAGALRTASAAELAAEWCSRLQASHDRTLVTRLYAGRGFQEARAAAAAIQADLVIVSAGLGLIEGSSAVPPYDLSVVPGTADNILARAVDDLSPAGWWQLISHASPFTRDLRRLLANYPGIIIVSISDAYLAMIADDLSALPAEALARLRIVTRAQMTRIPSTLRGSVMPYDDRLDGPNSTLRGTRGDFAARAGRHFAEAVVTKHPTATAQEHAFEVSRLLSAWEFPAVPERVRHTDDAIIALLRAHWDRAGGQSSKLLRVLRDELRVACEQGRFVGLMNRLRDEQELAA